MEEGIELSEQFEQIKQLEEDDLEFSQLPSAEYSVYARTNTDGKVEKIFSTCFEQPQDGDVFLKSGSGDEFVHTGYYQLFANFLAHKYCVDETGFRECTPQEVEAETENSTQNTTGGG